MPFRLPHATGRRITLRGAPRFIQPANVTPRLLAGLRFGRIGDIDIEPEISFLSPSGKTPIGDMIDASGLAAAFDGTLHQAGAASAEAGGGDSGQAYLGLDWGVGVTRTITSIKIYGANNTSIHNAASTHDIFLDIIGHTANVPGSATTISGHTAVSNVVATFNMEEETLATDISTAYRYHWCDLNSVFTAAQFVVSELEFYGY